MSVDEREEWRRDLERLKRRMSDSDEEIEHTELKPYLLRILNLLEKIIG